MDQKKWYHSKGIWIGIITFLVSVLEIVHQMVATGDFSMPALITAILGVAKVGERMIRSHTDIAV